MKTKAGASTSLPGLVIAFLLLAAPARAQSVVDGFNPNANNRVDVIAQQPDGRILIAGIYSTTSGSNNAGLARLHPDGTLDSSFVAPQIFGGFAPVRAIAVQDDGKVLLGGFFKTPAPFIRTNIIRLLPDGNVDTSFIADTENTVLDLLLLPGGKILVGGFFRTVNLQARQGIVCLESDGTLDPTFTITANQGVQAMLRQPNGKIVLSGQFTTLGGQTRLGLARLNPEGSLDLAFNPGAIFHINPNDGVHSLALQPDGRILAAGFFTISNSFTPSNYRQLLRFYPDGTFDNTFPAVTNSGVRVVAVQPDGNILVGGSFNTFLGQPRMRLARLNCDGSLQPAFSPQITGGSVGPLVSDLAIQPDGKIIVAGSFTNLAGHLRNNIGRLHADGAADATLSLASDNPVTTVTTQPDGKILLGGSFTQLAGVARSSIGRLNPDGTLDGAFDPGITNFVWNFAVQPDGRILVGGFFTNIAGEVRHRLARLHSDGTLDPSFNPGANNEVRSLVFQRDGHILVGGDFTMIGGQPRGRLARLDPNGNLDPTFDPPANNGVRAIAIQSDDQILVGGGFTNIAGQARQRIARLHPDGSPDPAFDPSANDWVRCLVVQPDGKILVAGQFTMLRGQPHLRIGRLNADGTFDPTFSAAANEQIWSLALEASGKIIVAGSFTMLNGEPCGRIGRLNSDGSLDATFGSGATDQVWAVALQPDGKVIAGGNFFSFDGQPRQGIARLRTTNAAFQALAFDSTDRQLTWTRGGAAPEVDLVVFEQSIDGTNYTLLDRAARITEGWQLSGVSLPIGQKVYVRARGRSFGGVYSTSSTLIESVAQFYSVPQPRIASATRVGTGPLQLTFDNAGHHPFTVFAATNLSFALWDAIGWPTNLTADVYQFTDSSATNSPQRFYRLRSP